ncbi:MAG: hypothetical protein AB1418_06785, partial [Pseudomonadota bacterium]
AAREKQRLAALEAQQEKAKREAALRAEQAERERQAALVAARKAQEAQRIRDEQAARERAALALKQARNSGPGGLNDPLRETPQQRAARLVREAKQSTGPRGMEEGL